MMNRIREILDNELKNIKPSQVELNNLQIIVNRFLEIIKPKLKKVNAGIMIGGSFAKNTIIKKKKYDVDFFVRFDYKRYRKKSDEISGILESILSKIINKIDINLRPKFETIHGSRDYFEINFLKTPINVSFEVIPVLRIKNSEEAVNVTDTSPLHVEYIRREIRKNSKLADEIRLIKAFCYSSNCYGAESYIHGFSGYSLELLTCHYGSFINFIRSALKWDIGEKIIIDSKKFYKKNDVIKKLNKAKIQSPLILIDPTQIDRNATASLSSECLLDFINFCKKFLKKPSSSFFIRKEKLLNIERLRAFAGKKKAMLEIIEVQSSKNRGDIAGAKLLKFFNFLIREFDIDFFVLKSDWSFDEDKRKAVFAFVLIGKREIISRGPPIQLSEHAEKFKKIHKNCFVKENILYSKRKPRDIESIILLCDLKNLGIEKIIRIS